MNNLIEIIRKIHEGPNGTVMEGLDRTLGRRVAVKEIRFSTPQEEDEIKAEIARSVRIREFLIEAPVVYGYRCDRAAHVISIYSEFINGVTLRDFIIAQHYPLSHYVLNRDLEIYIKACTAVGKLGKAKMVHKDLKPENLMVRETKIGAPDVFLIDFGSCGLNQRRFTGTPGYQAPEVREADSRFPVSAASDQFSMGIVLYEMLMGKIPNPEIAFAHRSGETSWSVSPEIVLPDSPASGKELNRIFRKMISYDPHGRYHNLELAAADIQKVTDRHHDGR